jgi:malate synthase
MEDAATAEISRTQVWQWLRHGARLSDGRPMTAALVEQTIATELQRFQDGRGGKFALAADLFRGMSLALELPEFLTGVAYEYLD